MQDADLRVIEAEALHVDPEPLTVANSEALAAQGFFAAVFISPLPSAPPGAWSRISTVACHPPPHALSPAAPLRI